MGCNNGNTILLSGYNGIQYRLICNDDASQNVQVFLTSIRNFIQTSSQSIAWTLR